MENNENKKHHEKAQEDYKANSGSIQPEFDENLRQKNTIPGNQTDQPTTAHPDEDKKPEGGRTYKETTDEDKLSDL